MQLDEKEQHIQQSKFNLLMEELSLDVETWKVYQSAVTSWKAKVEHEAACWKKKVWDESSHAVQSFLDTNVKLSAVLVPGRTCSDCGSDVFHRGCAEANWCSDEPFAIDSTV